jgi:hypothetical protein
MAPSGYHSNHIPLLKFTHFDRRSTAADHLFMGAVLYVSKHGQGLLQVSKPPISGHLKVKNTQSAPLRGLTLRRG